MPAALRVPVQHHIWQPADRGGQWAGCSCTSCLAHVSGADEPQAAVQGPRGLFCTALHIGLPSYLIASLQAKGNASEFSCGSPLSFFSPELPSFTKMPGRGLFLYGQQGLCVGRGCRHAHLSASTTRLVWSVRLPNQPTPPASVVKPSPLLCPTLTPAAAGSYNCTPSLRPGWDCSPLSTNLTELAQDCLDDPKCLSMPIKQGEHTH